MSAKLDQLRILSKDNKAKTGVLILAQLIADGFTPDEVLPYFMGSPTKKERETARVAAENLSAIAPYFDSLVKELTQETEGVRTPVTTIETDDGFDPTSKESIINQMKRQYQEAADPKQKADILVKLAELQRMKQEEVKEEKRQVMFFLPMSNCADCPCFAESREKHPDLELVDNRPTKIK